MKIISLCLLITLVSCGKNAFLNDALRVVSPAVGDNGGSSLDVSSKSIDFGKVLVGNKPFYDLSIKNTGDESYTDIQIEWNESFPQFSFESECSGDLEVDEECTVRVFFESSESTLGFATTSFTIGNEDTTYSVDVTVKGEAVEESAIEGELLLSYLKNGYVDFGTVYVGSSYKKLVHVESVGNELQRIVSAKSSGLASFASTNEAMACSSIVGRPCFFEVHLSPKTIGRKKEKITVKYFGLSDSIEKELEINVKYNAVNFNECFNFDQQVHIAKQSSDLNTYELNLIYPYYDQRSNSKASLERALNTAFTRYVSIGELVHQFNEDTQVFFSFNVERSSEDIYSAKLLLDLLKYEDIKTDSYNTEILCSLDYKLCSGKRFIEKEFRKLINRSFVVKNNRFSQVIIGSPNRMIQGLKFYKTRDVFHLNQYLGLKEKEIEKLVDLQGTLSFVMADDVKNERTPLLITSRRHEASCN